MQKSDNINELATALAKAQGAIQNAKKEIENPFFKRKYADLSNVWDVARTPLSANGLSVSQLAETVEGGTGVTTILMHSSGQWLSSSLDVHAQKQDPQGIGSAFTYARRYSLAAILGIATEDDDAESAMDRARAGVGKNIPPVQGTISPGIAEVRNAAKNAIAKYGKEPVLEVLKNHGWTKAEDIPADRYAEAIGILEGIK